MKGASIIRTPLLVPSFSSKGFPEVRKILQTMEEAVTDCVLVSAYDVKYGHIPGDLRFPEVVFLDSGGYECSKDTELSDLGYIDHQDNSEKWCEDFYREVLDKTWTYAAPTIVISYDHPKERLKIKDQVKRADRLFRGRKCGKELLIKPETKGARYIDSEAVIRRVHEYTGFDVLGFTEKELGNNLLHRMVSIAKIREGLQKAGIDIPIHIFGSLDTVSTPAYFLAGADIFDGLTWLRFAYKDGYTVYMHNYAATVIGTQIHDDHVAPRVWFNNYYALQELQRGMKNFLNANDFGMFPHHSELLRRTYETLQAELREK